MINFIVGGNFISSTINRHTVIQFFNIMIVSILYKIRQIMSNIINCFSHLQLISDLNSKDASLRNVEDVTVINSFP